MFSEVWEEVNTQLTKKQAGVKLQDCISTSKHTIDVLEHKRQASLCTNETLKSLFLKYKYVVVDVTIIIIILS